MSMAMIAGRRDLVESQRTRAPDYATPQRFENLRSAFAELMIDRDAKLGVRPLLGKRQVRSEREFRWTRILGTVKSLACSTPYGCFCSG
jgi:hypothetical protein